MNDDNKYNAYDLAQACGIEVDEAQHVIEQYDSQSNGVLDSEDYENLKSQILEQQQQNNSNNDNNENNDNDNDQHLLDDKLAASMTHATMDDDGDGRLSALELSNACDITLSEAQSIIRAYDKDGDGMLDPLEFSDLKEQILSQQRQKLDSKIDGASNLNAMDDNNDGKLSAKEFADACNLTESEAQMIIAQYDADGDGFLSVSEFENLKAQILAQQKEQREQKQKKQQMNNDDSKQKEFKRQWKLGMNFDPKNSEVVIYVSDEVTQQNWGITLNEKDFGGSGNIRQEYRKLGSAINNGTIDYNLDQYGTALKLNIVHAQDRWHYSCPQI